MSFPTWLEEEYRKQEAIPPMAVENVSGKFIPADSCRNERTPTSFPERRRNYVMVEENDDPKIGSRISDGVDRDCTRGGMISRHK